MNKFLLGQKIKDNDPRMGNRILTIVGFVQGYRVLAEDNSKRKFRIRESRVFTDGKPRKYAFNLLETVDD